MPESITPFRRFILGIHEFCYTLLAFPRAWRFMYNHRLWEGLRQYGWVARALVAIGVLGALYAISETVDWFDSHSNEPVYLALVGEDSILLRWFKGLYESMNDGVLNMATLVLLEVVIYHFMRRTLKIVLAMSVKDAHTFKPFLNAQIRMVAISVLAVVLQNVVIHTVDTFIAGTLVNDLFAVLVQAFFIGFVIADNYNEQFNLSIQQSARQLWRNYIAICLGLGLPLFVMLKVPVLGTVLGPLVTSVTAAIVLRELSDLHIVGYQMNEKEQKRADKKAAKAAKKAARKAAKAARKGVSV